MTKFLQDICLLGYRILAGTGLFETYFGKWLFVVAYDSYKELVEAKTADTLHQWVDTGTTVIDVGANIGFFTVRFARWVGSEGRVIAIEPEAENIRRLRRRINRANIRGHIDVVEGVAAEMPGSLHLTLNPHHPADHRIGSTGVIVRSWTIDEIVGAHQWPKVSLIKIDVQGAEVRVLQGARETIARSHPALFVEVDDDCLVAAGFSAEQLFNEIEGLGYRIYDPEHPSGPLTRLQAEQRRQKLGYFDYLCRIER
jgi:FkbM family methyltransferase